MRTASTGPCGAVSPASYPPTAVRGGSKTDGQTGEAGRQARQERQGAGGDGRAHGGGLDGRHAGEDRDEGDEQAHGRGEDERDERAVAGRGDQHEDQRRDEHGGAGEEELQPARSVPGGERQQPGAAHGGVRHRADAEGDGRAAVLVHAGADAGEGEEEERGDAGEDAGQAVRVVARIGLPQDEREQDEQHRAAEEAGAAHQAVGPEPAVAGDGGGDGVRDVVEDRRGQRLGEGPQGEQFPVEDALRGQRAGGVEHRPVAAHQVVPDRAALDRALAGEPEDLRVQVGDRDVLGQRHVDAPVRRDDGDAAEAGSAAGRRRGTRVTGRGGRRWGRHAHLLLPLVVLWPGGSRGPVSVVARCFPGAVVFRGSVVFRGAVVRDVAEPGPTPRRAGSGPVVFGPVRPGPGAATDAVPGMRSECPLFCGSSRLRKSVASPYRPAPDPHASRIPIRGWNPSPRGRR